MITAGIDVGVETVKAVVLRDGSIAGYGKALSGGATRAMSAELAYANALQMAGLSAADISKTVATGKGKYDVTFADDRITEPICAANAAKYYNPESTCAVDVGADETLALTMGETKHIEQFVLNEACAAGIGCFIKHIAKRLDLTLEEISEISPPAQGASRLNAACAVFAELDALDLLNNGVPPKEVAAAILDAAAVRVSAVINDITFPSFEVSLLFGGLSKNKAFVKALESYSGISFTIPENSEYAGALGAALFAVDGVIA